MARDSLVKGFFYISGIARFNERRLYFFQVKMTIDVNSRQIRLEVCGPARGGQAP